MDKNVANWYLYFLSRGLGLKVKKVVLIFLISFVLLKKIFKK
ncbi:hypothetical protein BROOK1789C_1395 [Bathymodiolus brooksi thiotrophic gill symbiont]|nr:hypothetical protein BROOK1789C_1395 [Bathymodiolus brooksi thiotrophic gill symbiont]